MYRCILWPRLVRSFPYVAQHYTRVTLGCWHIRDGKEGWKNFKFDFAAWPTFTLQNVCKLVGARPTRATVYQKKVEKPINSYDRLVANAIGY